MAGQGAEENSCSIGSNWKIAVRLESSVNACNGGTTDLIIFKGRRSRM